MSVVKVQTSQVRALDISGKANSSFNEETRTIDVTFATETPVLTRDYEGNRFYEVLSCNPKHIRSQRVAEGAPVLDNHSKYGSATSMQLGVTENLQISGGRASATLRFSQRSELDGLMLDIKDGIIRNISCGYNVYAYEDISEEGAKIRTFRAIDWEPYEVSIAPIQADPNSRMRSKEHDNTQFTEVQIHNTHMDTPVTEQVIPVTVPAPVVTTPAVDNSGLERTRSMEIINAVAKAGLSPELATEHVQKGTTVEQFRALVIDKLIETKSATNQQTNHITVTTDERDKTRALMEIGLTRKLGVHVETPFTSEEISKSEEYREMSAMDMARAWMLDAGDSTAARMGVQALSKRALVSSSSFDFPVLLEGVARRVMLRDYAIQSDIWRRIAEVGSVSDFREFKRIRGGTIGNLDKVGQNGEFKNKDLPDGHTESIIIGTFGNTVNVTRQMLINDDLGQFLKITSQLTRAAARSIESDFANMVNKNDGKGPNMSDNKTLFHTDHKNIVTSMAFGAKAVAAARDLMESQKDFNDNDFLDLTPHTLFVPAGLYDEAILLNTSVYADESGKYQKKNIYNGLFTDVVKSRRLTSATRHYTFADKDVEPTFEVAFLNGQETPFLDSREEFDVDGVRWKIRHDWGMAAIGFKGATMNEGVA